MGATNYQRLHKGNHYKDIFVRVVPLLYHKELFSSRQHLISLLPK